jgi:oligoendopeptidase F
MSSELNTILQTSDVIWNLADLYQGIDDPRVEGDLRQCEDTALAINKKYSGRLNELSAAELCTLVSDLEAMEVLFGRIATFASLQFAVNTLDQRISAFYQKIREAGSRISRETVFFELEWNKVQNEPAAILLDAPGVARYRHYLFNMRRYAPHQLSQIEEMLLLEKAPVGRGSWTTLFEKVMGHLRFGEQGRTEEEVLSDLYSTERHIRQKAAVEMTAGLQSQFHVLTHIFNTLLADKMISDRLRRYDAWISSMNLGNELEDTTVSVLIEAVTSRYDIPQRYYRVKRNLLGLDELLDYDRYAPLPHLPSGQIPWKTCQKTVLAAFHDFSPEMAGIADMFFQKKWIHAPVAEGKRGGAFAHPCVPEVHPYILVNYTGNLRDVSTVAHELGHGVHQYLAAANGYYNANTPLVLAETASVFAELLTFTFQLDLIDGADERRAFICQKLESIFATVFRQVAMNRFEDKVHNARREQGELSTEDISQKWLATQRQMFEDSVRLTDDYGIWWSYIPHFLSTPGYVYSYAFGELLVLALYNLYKKTGQSFVPKYLALLKAGGSLSPYELLKPFGVDPDDQKFWNGGLQIIDEMLAQVE